MLKLPALLAAVLVVPLAAAPAAAAPPDVDRFREVIDESFDEVLCDIPVTTHVIVNQTITETFSDGEFVGAKVAGRFTVTSTAANGQSVSNQGAGLSRFSEVVNPDGTVTFTGTYQGLQSKFRTEDGGAVFSDRGLITLVTTVDFGDPADDEDDVLVAQEVIRQAGPHPEADADFELFCEAVQEALA